MTKNQEDDAYTIFKRIAISNKKKIENLYELQSLNKKINKDEICDENRANSHIGNETNLLGAKLENGTAFETKSDDNESHPPAVSVEFQTVIYETVVGHAFLLWLTYFV